MAPRKKASPADLPPDDGDEIGLQLSGGSKPRSAPVPTLASIVQQRIGADIARGELAPGARLEEEELARRYQVSRTPVREALRQLSALGIVDTKPRQGMVVAARSAEHFNNLLEVVAELEAASARYAAQRMTEAERAALAKVHDQMRAITRSGGGAGQFDQANSQLHRLIHEGAHNDILFNGIVQMRMRTLPYTRVEFISERERMEISFMEHNAIVQAILHGEAELAYHAMRSHVLDAGHVHEDREPVPQPVAKA